MIREIIAKLADGQALTRAEARGVMEEIMSGAATPAQIAAYITALRLRGETAEIIAGSVEAMRARVTPVDAGGGVVVDVVGTGGDGRHTFNISTAAAFVAAGAGAKVAKHGNRNVSSKCGSADVLTALGVNIEQTPAQMGRCLREEGIAFLFAPLLHPAMKYAAGPRREIGIRTIFNILGPLTNPAGARHGLLGVYHPQLVSLIAKAAADLGAQRLFVVHGRDGMDEITITDATLVAEVKDGAIREYEITPEQFGLARAPQAALVGGTPEENAVIVREILAGGRGPRRDIVLLNAAAAIAAAGLAADVAGALPLAARSVDSGAAAEKLRRLVEITRAL